MSEWNGFKIGEEKRKTRNIIDAILSMFVHIGCHNALQILFICQYIVSFKADVTNKTDRFIGGFNYY